MRLRFLAPLLLLACHHDPPAPAPAPAPQPVTVPVGPPAPTSPTTATTATTSPRTSIPLDPTAPVVEAPHALELRRDTLVDGWYWRCSVIDKTANAVIGVATGEDVAAGGTTVECTDIAADGKVIIFANSRSSAGKDARLGKTNNRALPCGEGVYANDLSSCLSLDASPFSYGEPEPFELRLADIAHGKAKVLVSIPRGLERFDAKRGRFMPRWWDAKYCSEDRLLVVANGTLRLFEAPSGGELANVPAPAQTRITECARGAAETTSASGEKRSWKIRRDGIE